MRYCQALGQKVGWDGLFCAPDFLMEVARLMGAAGRVCSPRVAAALGMGRWFPLLSASGLLGVTAGESLVREPYRRVPELRQEAWAERLQASLADGHSASIGPTWQGVPKVETKLFGAALCDSLSLLPRPKRGVSRWCPCKKASDPSNAIRFLVLIIVWLLADG